MRMPDIVLDHRTAKLVKVVKAFTLAEDVPLTVGRQLNNAATAVRMLAEAGEITAAGELAERLGSIAQTLEVENPTLDWGVLITKAAMSVHNATGPGKQVR